MSWITKLVFISLLSGFSSYSFGQKYIVRNKKVSYFGLIGGVNFSFPKVTDRYSVLTSTESMKEGTFDKKYDKLWANRGVQFGARYSYNFTNSLALVTGFNYTSFGFKYFTDYSWSDTVNKQDLSREMHHLQKISYFSIPIMARWDLVKGQIKPYVQGGFLLDFRHQAKKVIHYDPTIDGEETENQLSSSPEVSIADYTRKFNLGIVGGVGLNYYTKFITFGLETNFNYGFRKIMRDDNRYSDINGFALQYLDVLDQMKWRNIHVQVSVSIPIYNAVSGNILKKRRY